MTVGLTRITPEPTVVATWQLGVLVAVVALALLLAVAALLGLLLRRSGPCDVVSSVTVTAALAGGLVWAGSTAVAVPPALGGTTVLAGAPLAAAAVAGLLAAVAAAVGRRGPSRAEADAVVG